MEKKIKIVLLFYFLLILYTIGITSIVEINKKELIKELMTNPDKAIVDNIPSRTKNLLLFPRYYWNKSLHKKFYFEDNAYINKDNSIIYGSFKEGDITFSLEKIKELNNYAKKNNINFLYVILPGKPLYDEELTNNNISCYRNKTADKMVEKLKKNNIPYIDLRDNFRNSNENPYKWFYKTDHHWNSDAGLEAARLITEELNKRYNVKLNSKNLETSKIKRKVYHNLWIGENGKKIYGSKLEKEDYIANLPNYRTHILLTNETTNIKEEGDFSVLLNERILKNYDDLGKNSLYYYYLYSNEFTMNINNFNNKNGKILYIKDSYSNVVIPFLALTTSNLTAYDIRSGSSLYSYLEGNHKYDTIVVAYTIATIPTHDMNDFK